MATPAASTKSVNSTSPEAQNATSKDVHSPQRPEHTNSQQQPANGDSVDTNADGDQRGEGVDEEGYPPQKHAGAIGLGPEYGKMREATASDKIAGLKDELVGKVTRNHEKVQHGHDQRTGELKRKKFEEEDSADPFNTAGDDDSTKKPGDTQSGSSGTDAGSGPNGNTDNAGSDGAAGNAAPTSVTGKRGAGTHATEAGAQEQAATTAPEGTEDAERQRQGENTYADRQVDEGPEAKKLKSE